MSVAKAITLQAFLLAGVYLFLPPINVSVTERNNALFLKVEAIKNIYAQSDKTALFTLTDAVYVLNGSAHPSIIPKIASFHIATISFPYGKKR